MEGGLSGPPVVRPTPAVEQVWVPTVGPSLHEWAAPHGTPLDFRGPIALCSVATSTSENRLKDKFGLKCGFFPTQSVFEAKGLNQSSTVD